VGKRKRGAPLALSHVSVPLGRGERRGVYYAPSVDKDGCTSSQFNPAAETWARWFQSPVWKPLRCRTGEVNSINFPRPARPEERSKEQWKKSCWRYGGFVGSGKSCPSSSCRDKGGKTMMFVVTFAVLAWTLTLASLIVKG